ncbi:hypothetical protein HGA88_01750 [Candidatus Roizmanbacteria bacterium]|nr:hypothetical protein [Candidatus Roizmanbacteria bacterium]
MEDFKIYIYLGKSLPEEYKDDMSMIIEDLKSDSKGEIDKTHQGVNFEPNNEFVIATKNNKVVAFLNLSRSSVMCVISYMARANPEGKGIPKKLIKYIQDTNKYPFICAIISSLKSENVKAILQSCDFIYDKGVYCWKRI